MPSWKFIKKCDETKFPIVSQRSAVAASLALSGGEKKSLNMHDPLPVILVVVWSSTSGFEWLGFHSVQSQFCFVWSEIRGVIETVVMIIEAIRKTLFLEPSSLVLHVSPFCGLQSESSIPGCIDGGAGMEGKQKGLSARFSHVGKHLSVLCILS